MSKIRQYHIRAERGLYNHRELAERLGVGYTTVTRLAKLFPPAYQLGRCRVWTTEQVETIREHVDAKRKRRDTLISVRAAARKFGITKVTWEKAIKRGRIPGPTHPGHNRAARYYTRKEVEYAARYFEGRKRPAGYMTAQAVAKEFGQTLRAIHQAAKTHGIGITLYRTTRYFSSQDVARLKAMFGVNRKGVR